MNCAISSLQEILNIAEQQFEAGNLASGATLETSVGHARRDWFRQWRHGPDAQAKPPQNCKDSPWTSHENLRERPQLPLLDVDSVVDDVVAPRARTARQLRCGRNRPPVEALPDVLCFSELA